MSYSIHTKNCSRLSLREVQFYTKDGRFAFLRPRGLGTIFLLGSLESARSGLPISVN